MSNILDAVKTGVAAERVDSETVVFSIDLNVNPDCRNEVMVDAAMHEMTLRYLGLYSYRIRYVGSDTLELALTGKINDNIKE